MVKGPCILSWTFRTDVKNLEEAKHNYMVLRFGPKNKPIKMEEISVAGLEINWIVFFLKRKLYFLKLFGMFSSHWCWKNVVWNVCLKKFAYFVIWVEVFLHPCSICRSFFFSTLNNFASVCGRIFMTENLWLYCVCLREWNQIRKSVHFVIFAFVTWISCCKNCQQISLLSPSNKSPLFCHSFSFFPCKRSIRTFGWLVISALKLLMMSEGQIHCVSTTGPTNTPNNIRRKNHK